MKRNRSSPEMTAIFNLEIRQIYVEKASLRSAGKSTLRSGSDPGTANHICGDRSGLRSSQEDNLLVKITAWIEHSRTEKQYFYSSAQIRVECALDWT